MFPHKVKYTHQLTFRACPKGLCEVKRGTLMTGQS